MPMSVKMLSGPEVLSLALARRWLAAERRLGSGTRFDSALNTFLTKGSKTYGFLQAAEFCADFTAFYQAYRSISRSLANLAGYREHLETLKNNKHLAGEVLLASGWDGCSEDIGALVVQVVAKSLEEEISFVEECKASLGEQLNWHLTGSTHKGLVPDNKLRLARQQVASSKSPKETAKYHYYEPVRNRLMSMGFVVSPRGTALGALFPEDDWLVGITSESEFLRRVKEVSDELMLRYRLIGDDRSSLTRLLMPPDLEDKKHPLVSAIGCVCVSWTRHRKDGKTIYIPFLGLSGVIEAPPTSQYFQQYCRHLALPSWEPDPPSEKLKDTQATPKISPDRPVPLTPFQQSHSLSVYKEKTKKLLEEIPREQLSLMKKKDLEKMEGVDELLRYKRRTQKAQEMYDEEKKRWLIEKALENELRTNYEVMLERTNFAAVEFRFRENFGLRCPSRQALMSYVSFREERTSKHLKIESIYDAGWGADLWVCGWHSLNCAEPAALMAACSFLCGGTDVLICLPYEGFGDTGPMRNRPKETCAWCAAVELGFRSVKLSPGGVDQSVQRGLWRTENTRHFRQNEPRSRLSTKREFDAFDDRNPISQTTHEVLGSQNDLVDNTNLSTPAYSDEVVTKIGRMRSLYYLLGLLDPELVLLDRPLLPHAEKIAML